MVVVGPEQVDPWTSTSRRPPCYNWRSSNRRRLKPSHVSDRCGFRLPVQLMKPVMIRACLAVDRPTNSLQATTHSHITLTVYVLTDWWEIPATRHAGLARSDVTVGKTRGNAQYTCGKNRCSSRGLYSPVHLGRQFKKIVHKFTWRRYGHELCRVCRLTVYKNQKRVWIRIGSSKYSAINNNITL